MNNETEGFEPAKKSILDFMKKHTLAVLSTVSAEGRKPQSALLAFIETEDLHIAFGTSNASRKYKNLQVNGNVSLVIGWDGRKGTVQYEGIARELTKKESVPYAAAQIAKNPSSKAFADREDQHYFLVTPTWIRFLDASSELGKSIEISFDHVVW